MCWKSGAMRLLLLALVICCGREPAARAADSAVRFHPRSERLEGNQFLYDCGFELLDWNGDGKLDVFLPNTGMMSFAAHLNEGTVERPQFGSALGYPVNLTETEPQTIEHGQAFAVGDLNGDGLFDLIMFDGQLRMIFNTGTAHGPNHWKLANLPPHFFPGTERMILENARFSTGPESMYWNKGIFARQALTLGVTDWDGDGLQDLVICRFQQEAPGVMAAGGPEQWTAWGRTLLGRPHNPLPPANAPKFFGPLAAAPARSTVFYRNVGTREQPQFDAGVELTTAGKQPIAAPNPIAVDVDGDGLTDLVSCEAPYSCNAFRVDWPTQPSVVWFRRKAAGDAELEPGRPLTTKAGEPIPAGVQIRCADIRNRQALDLFVMDSGSRGSIRWYRNAAGPKEKLQLEAPVELRGRDFARFGFMQQPVIVNWFGPNSRDLIIHGCIDAHCKWALRRTALYRNVARTPGQTAYEFAGWLNFQGDPQMVPRTAEDRPYDVYGSSISIFPGAPADKRLLMSVDGRLYLFSNLAADGLTYQQCTPVPLQANRNRHKGWQEITVDLPHKVRYLRINNDRNGMGNLRDSFLHIVNFEAWGAGKNHATLDSGVTIVDENTEKVPWYRVQQPQLMFTPGNEPSDREPRFTSFGYYIGHGLITLKESVKLDKLRFRLSDREQRWYSHSLPFYWQGKHFRDGTETGEPWYQYKIEASEDGKTWSIVADTMRSEMIRSFPELVDWDRDGKVDLLLGVLNTNGIWPAQKEYRLYRNQGSNEQPQWNAYEPLLTADGKPMIIGAFWYSAYALQCGLQTADLDADGKLDLVVEGHGNSELFWYRNVTEAGQTQPRFELVRALGDPRPIRYQSGYRYFDIADVDGDGIIDVLDSPGNDLMLFRGTAASAPAAIADLEQVESTAEWIALRWSLPADAVRYEFRWSREPAHKFRWSEAQPTEATLEITLSENVEVATLSDLPAGELLSIAVRSFNAAGAASPPSESISIVTWPLRRIVLRNGPVKSLLVPTYAGTEAAYLDAHRPDQPAGSDASELVARAPGEEKQKVIVIRFRDLPRLQSVKRAVLELTTVPSTDLLAAPATLATSCNACRNDWQSGLAAWSQAAPGLPWESRELTAGGRFLAVGAGPREVRLQHQLSWDVTEAVRTAGKDGTNGISLLIRVDNTGKYIHGQGWRFHGINAAVPHVRPRLIIDTAAE